MTTRRNLKVDPCLEEPSVRSALYLDAGLLFGPRTAPRWAHCPVLRDRAQAVVAPINVPVWTLGHAATKPVADGTQCE